MIVLHGGALVLPDGVRGSGTLVIDGDRIVDVRDGDRGSAGADTVDLRGALVLPGFVDQHVHGLLGFDTLDAPDSRDGVREMAARLPAFGVTAFCPTTVACPPAELARCLDRVAALRAVPEPPGARVLPAHLESNFLNPEYRGAQPAACLRHPPGPALAPSKTPAGAAPADDAARSDEDFDAEAILAVIAAHRPEVGIVTLAPELAGAPALIDRLVSAGHRVSLGHSAATFEEARAAFARGARGVTHLFNRMPPLGHREPGLAGAALAAEDVVLEVIGDGHHVHPAMVRLATEVGPPGRVVAVTDATAAAGLPVGTRTTLGGQPIAVRSNGAYLDDGTLAGSVATMDRVFACLVKAVGLSLPAAAALCATTPAHALGLADTGTIAVGAVADLTVLDADLRVQRTYVGGRLVYHRPA